ncbi:hypothetical protein AB1Y20_016919 [Prymnesium parvum]|uniref:Uncharacterized protein n=1 Tax=Prymnesium parvum TaxID=97485 RepID=A0AB34I9G4_PRYPA
MMTLVLAASSGWRRAVLPPSPHPSLPTTTSHPRRPTIRLCLHAAVLLSEQGERMPPPGLAAALESDALALLAAASLADGHQLSVTLCDDPFIRALNLRWRAVDAPTDVLSFPLDDELLLGDVVLSVETAQRQAEERGHPLRDELRVLLVHGLLHLLGYDHEEDEAARAEMAEAEQRLLRRLGWEGQGLIALAAEEGEEAVED